MPDTTQDYEKFSEQLPLYVNGTLDPDERAWVDAYLQTSSKAQGDLKLSQLMSEAINSYTSPVPESVRLSRLLTSWHASRDKPSPLQTLLAWIKFPLQVPAAAMAVVTMLIVGQFGLLLNRPAELEGSAWRGEQRDCASAPLLRVVFAPDAKQGDIVLLLRSANASWHDGPSDTGEVWLSVSKGHSIQEAIATLRASSLVDDVVEIAATADKVNCKP